MQVSAKGVSQKITLSAQNNTLEWVFEHLKTQTGYSFLVNGKELDRERTVSFSVSDASLDDVMGLCLKGTGMVYVLEGRVVLIKPAERVALIASPPPPPEIHGRVMDSTGTPLSGASIQVKGSHTMVETDVNGNFNLKNVPSGSELVVTYSGYQAKVVKWLGRGFLSIRMALRNSPLDEVQIIAYGSTTKRFNVGNVSTVTSEDIAKQPITDPLLALEGRVPGMMISQGTGVQGGAVNVNIRGLNSLTAGEQPLYIIDGIPFNPTMVMTVGFGAQDGGGTPSAFNFINPADIEEIDVLKDADATAIYGSRGANGVVLVTTKKGKAGKSELNINVYSGVSTVPMNRLHLMNTEQYLHMRHQAFYLDSTYNPLAQITPTVSSAPDLMLWDTTRQTDWKKTALGNVTRATNAQATFSGGNNLIQYNISGHFNRQGTVFMGSYFIEDGGVHVNVNSSSSNGRFKVSVGGDYTFNKQLFPWTDLVQYLLNPPNTPPPFNKDGSLNWAPNPANNGFSSWPFATNPYVISRELAYPSSANNMMGNMDVSYKILPYLLVRANLGYNKNGSTPFNGNPIAAFDPAQSAAYNRTGIAFYGISNSQSTIFEPQISFDPVIGDGKLNVLVGGSVQATVTSGENWQVNGIQNDALLNNPAAGTSYSGYGSGTNYRYAAAFGRINYNLKQRYILDLNMRRDGSSRFGPSKQFANFGDVAAGWIFTEESFMKPLHDIMDFGKIRASYGITGNDQIGDYQYLDRYQLLASYMPQSQYQGTVGLQQVGLFNPNFNWERTDKAEVGLETGFLKDRIIFTFSYYWNKSSNQLQSIALPSLVGATSVQGNVPATISNRGEEIELNTKNIQNSHFFWSSSFNISFQRNRLLSYTGTDANFQYMVGKSLASVLLYHGFGVDPQSGRYLFADNNGKPVTFDQGANPYATTIDLAPKFFGGFDNTFSYRDFSLSVFFSYVRQKAANSNFQPGVVPGSMYNEPTALLDSWTGPGSHAKYERYSQDGHLGGDNSTFQNSDMAYTDASFIRCRNLAVSWSLPAQTVKHLHMETCRIYIQAQNLFTITDYPGWDPENHTPYAIPPMHTWTFGVSLSL